MGESEQVKALAPSSSSLEHDPPPISINDHFKFRRRKCVQCCGCVTAFSLIIVVTFLIFSFTVYNVKEPQLRLNGVTLLNATLSNGANVALMADVSVKNPNVFTFRFGPTTTVLYYNGTGIGEGRTPAGKARGRRTLRLNVTMEIAMGNLDVMSHRALNMRSHTIVDGKVKVLNVFNRKVGVEMNCSVEYNITNGSTQGQNCLSRVHI